MEVTKVSDDVIVCSPLCAKIVKLDSFLDMNDRSAMFYLESEMKKKTIVPASEEHKPLSYESELHWDPTRSSKDTIFDNEMKRATIEDLSYNFHTVHADLELNEPCTHYWEVKLLANHKSDVKIGVSKKQRFNFKSAFCDHHFGWGIFAVDGTL